MTKVPFNKMGSYAPEELAQRGGETPREAPQDCERRADGWVYCAHCKDWWPPTSVHATREPHTAGETPREHPDWCRQSPMYPEYMESSGKYREDDEPEPICPVCETPRGGEPTPLREAAFRYGAAMNKLGQESVRQSEYFSRAQELVDEARNQLEAALRATAPGGPAQTPPIPCRVFHAAGMNCSHGDPCPYGFMGDGMEQPLRKIVENSLWEIEEEARRWPSSMAEFRQFVFPKIAALRVALSSGGPREAPFDTQPDDREWAAATEELFEALGRSYGVTRDQAKGHAFRALCAARRAGGPAPSEEGFDMLNWSRELADVRFNAKRQNEAGLTVALEQLVRAVYFGPAGEPDHEFESADGADAPFSDCRHCGRSAVFHRTEPAGEPPR